jgi:hypothetical protein
MGLRPGNPQGGRGSAGSGELICIEKLKKTYDEMSAVYQANKKASDIPLK